MSSSSLIFLTLALADLSASQGRVSVTNGQVWLELDGSARTELPEARGAIDATLTTDSKSVVFSREGSIQGFDPMVWELNLVSRQERQLLDERLFKSLGGYPVAGFYGPYFDAARKRLWVLATDSVVEGWVVEIDLNGKFLRKLIRASSYCILGVGQHKGSLLVLRRHHAIDNTVLYLYWIVSRNGRVMSIAGRDDQIDQKYYCSDRYLPAPAPSR